MWAPSPERVERANITRYLHWLRDRRGLRFATYDELWRWSVDDLDGFWSAVWTFFDVRSSTPYDAVLRHREMPGTEWFPGARLNYAERAVATTGPAPAVISRSQSR